MSAYLKAAAAGILVAVLVASMMVAVACAGTDCDGIAKPAAWVMTVSFALAIGVLVGHEVLKHFKDRP